ncbi:SDR family oxidoreductase [Asaia prunellae]|uniref:SDR family oxidoreductase n=1 Tax=Asaia prunellae TaxID=610245 RepID=UPI00046E8657|nr:SDR family oxidoreductase [Asaia prunellae]
MTSILITGAGTGFGRLLAFSLARRGHAVHAGVEITSQIGVLRQEARAQGLALDVSKLDITSPRDRAHILREDFDILVNNAGIGQGGSLADMPDDVLRHQYEVNFFATVALTREYLHARRNSGATRVIFMSSIGGILTVPFAGAYCGSKHALETVAQSMHLEFAERDVTIATINPGPYQTNFNDLIMEGPRYWQSDRDLFDHSKLTFDMPQYKEDQDIETMADITLDPRSRFRNILPRELEQHIREQEQAIWNW